MNDTAIKAGRRYSASTKAMLKAIKADMKEHEGASAAFFTKMADYLKAMGFEDEAEAVEEMAEDAAEDEAEEGGDDDGPAVKALSLTEQAEMVEEAIIEALEELGAVEDTDPMHVAASVVMETPEGEHGHAPDPMVWVYDGYAVACLPSGDWRLGYAIEAGEVVLDTPDAWQRVEKEWRPVKGARSIVEAQADAAQHVAAQHGASVQGGAIKMLDDGSIVAQAVRYGTPDEPDISLYNDFFTKATDFWLGQWDAIPMLYHHGMDEGTADAPVIGRWVKAWKDDAGVWLQGQLDKAHRYHAAIKEMARRGLLSISTDSAPHLVKRARRDNGTNEIKTWPIYAASLTPTPAEPRLLPVEVKAILAQAGLPIDAGTEADAPADRESADGRKAADGERLRLLALELDLLTLENQL